MLTPSRFRPVNQWARHGFYLLGKVMNRAELYEKKNLYTETFVEIKSSYFHYLLTGREDWLSRARGVSDKRAVWLLPYSPGTVGS